MSGEEIEKVPGLSSKQRGVLIALADERTITAAATKAHVSRSSIYRWLEDPLFRGEVGRIRRRLFEEALELLNAGQAKAVSRMLEALNDHDRNIRLRAAIAIVQLGLDVKEGAEMENRLADLERRAGIGFGE